MRYPVVRVQQPKTKDRSYKFFFVEFADAVLASTAVSMSGLIIRRRSARVFWTGGGPAADAATQGLDVEPLRLAHKIPWSGGPGLQMVCSVWVGSFAREVGKDTAALVAMLTRAVLALPLVREHFPDLGEPVLGLRVGHGRSFAFVDLAREALASSLVCMGELELAHGRHIKVGWPDTCQDAAARAAPSLYIPSETQPDPESSREADDGARESGGRPGGEVGHNFDCDVFVGSTHGAEAAQVWGALAELFTKLPAYRSLYDQSGPGPIASLKTGHGSFAFATLADPVLASTAIAAGYVSIGGRRAQLSRPIQYKPPSGGPALPLDINPAPQQVLIPRIVQTPRPPPPPAPVARAATLWVGGLQPRGTEAEACEALDAHLTRLALESPGYNLDAGPPLQRVSLHPSGRFAFVDLRDATLAEQLIPIYDGSECFGRPIAVNWAKRRNTPSHARAETKAAFDLDGRNTPSHAQADIKAAFDLDEL